MIELRGIIVDMPDSGMVVRLIVRDTGTGTYRTFILPPGLRLDRATILEFLSQQYRIATRDIIWPSHVEIPGGV